MKSKFLALLLLPILVFADPLQGENQQKLIVNNRILATVNGKSITVIDVMKKMDVFLTRAYPEYAKSNSSRHQFFTQNWRDTLNQIIDNELILADAEKIEFKIPDAEIREIIHERFGPNVMSSLDSIGISLDDAWRMIYTEMAVQRMSYYRVHSKALALVGPQDIKQSYENFLITNPPKEEWKYQVLSIRAATDALGSVFAKKASALIRNEPLPFESLAQALKEEMKDDSNVTITVSEEYDVEGSKLSQAHKNVLCSLDPGHYSELVTQVSRRDKSIAHRIFYLKEHNITPTASFDSKVEDLHDDLVMSEVSAEFPLYLKKLRKLFNYDESTLNSLPSDFQPFSLR